MIKKSLIVEPKLVGNSPKRLIDTLVKTYELCVTESRPIWVSLEGHSGCGKSRMIHELYRSLAKTQKTPYWPDTIYSGSEVEQVEDLRKVVCPHFDTTTAETFPDYMWWGIRCGTTGRTPSETLSNDLRQFQLHELPLETAYRKKLTTGKNISRSLKSILLKAYSGGKEDILGSLEEGISTSVFGELLAEFSGLNILRRPISAIWEQNKKLEAGIDAFRKGHTIDQTPAQEPIDTALEMISSLSTDGVIPVVIYIEDLQDASNSLVSVITGLMTRPDLAVLIVTTTWPGELDTNTNLAPLKTLGPLDTHGKRRVHRVRDRFKGISGESFDHTSSLFGEESTALTTADMREIIMQYYPNVTDGRANEILEKIRQPLLLVLLLNELIREKVDSLESLSKSEIGDLPSSVHQHYDIIWTSLPDSVRNTLIYGLLTVPHVVNDSYRKDSLEWSFTLLRSAIQTEILDIEIIGDYSHEPQVFHWVRRRDERLSSYNDWVQFEQVLRHVSKIRRRRSRFMKAIARCACNAYSNDYSGFGSNQYLQQLIISLADSDPHLITDNAVLQAVYWQRVSTLSQFPNEIEETIRYTYKLLNYYERYDLPDALFIRCRLCFWIGESGDFETALQLSKDLQPDLERELGENHPETLNNRHNIAFFTGESGDYQGALVMFKELLTDREKFQGSESRTTLLARNNIAFRTGQTGDTEAALQMFKNLLFDQQRVLGMEDRDTLTTLNNIAFTIGNIGDLATAIEINKDVAKLRVRSLGADHQDTLASRHNIAFLTGKMGNVESALALSHDLLVDRLRILGDSHPDTLENRNALAYLTAQNGDIEVALVLLKDLLKDRVRIFGEGHPSTFITRQNIIEITDRGGDTQTALQLCRELFLDKQSFLGHTHPNTLETGFFIAVLTEKSGDASKALHLFNDLLPIAQRVLGNEERITLYILDKIANLTLASGDANTAFQLFNELLPKQQLVLGEDSYTTLNSLNNMAVLSWQRGDFELACKLFEDLLHIQQRLLKDDDVYLLMTRNSIASCKERMGDLNSALLLYQELLPDLQSILGENDPQVIQTKKMMQLLHNRLDVDSH
ncbi:MAG: tetratricopeptide repeat protein [Granulosicoccus sp.]